MIKFPLYIICDICIYFTEQIIKHIDFLNENNENIDKFDKFKHLRSSILKQIIDKTHSKDYNRKVSIKLLNYIRSISKKIKLSKLLTPNQKDPLIILTIIFSIIYKLRAANYMKFKHIEKFRIILIKLKEPKVILNIKEKQNLDEVFELVKYEFR